MAQILDQTIQKQLREVFEEIKQSVHLLFFGSSDKERCEYCQETQQLLEEVAAQSDLVTLETFDVDKLPEAAASYAVERVPGIIIAAKDGAEIRDLGVRISGIPAGHEFNALVNDILVVASRNSGLSETTKKALQTIDQRVHMYVFTTPT